MQYEQKTGQSILESLESNGLKPNHHCRNGFCGMCRVKINPDDIKHIAPIGDVLGFHDHNSEILACVSTIESDQVDLFVDPPGEAIRLHHEDSTSFLKNVDIAALRENIEKRFGQEQRTTPALA